MGFFRIMHRQTKVGTVKAETYEIHDEMDSDLDKYLIELFDSKGERSGVFLSKYVPEVEKVENEEAYFVYIY